jgi:hypothetical protein
MFSALQFLYFPVADGVTAWTGTTTVVPINAAVKKAMVANHPRMNVSRDCQLIYVRLADESRAPLADGQLDNSRSTTALLSVRIHAAEPMSVIPIRPKWARIFIERLDMLAKERKNSHTFIAAGVVLAVAWATTHQYDVWCAWGTLSEYTGWLPHPPS